MLLTDMAPALILAGGAVATLMALATVAALRTLWVAHCRRLDYLAQAVQTTARRVDLAADEAAEATERQLRAIHSLRAEAVTTSREVAALAGALENQQGLLAKVLVAPRSMP